MVGNDIIDIKQTQLDSDWRRPGFVQKVFNQQERSVITEATDPFHAVWRMWSMKESAYKLYLQLNPRQARFFNPSKIACELFSESQGVVKINGTSMATRTWMNSDYIFTHAAPTTIHHVDTHVFYIKDTDPHRQSNCTHEKLKKYICKKENIEKGGIEIRKTQRTTPRVYYKNQALAIDISLTHHGNYGAFSIINN